MCCVQTPGLQPVKGLPPDQAWGAGAGPWDSVLDLGEPEGPRQHGCRPPRCHLACPHADFRHTPCPDGSSARRPLKILLSLSSLTFQTLTFWQVRLPNRCPRWRSGKESACQCRTHKRCRFDPWVGKIPWRRKWQPTPACLLENSMDRGAWWAMSMELQSQTRLSD